MPAHNPEHQPRHLLIVLGDQLSTTAPIFDDADPKADAIWMAENAEETTHVWCHKLRIAFFFSAMRHFRDTLRVRGFTVHYTEMGENPADDRGKNFAEILAKDIQSLKPEKLVVTEPGDWRVHEQLKSVAKSQNVPLEIRTDNHFYITTDEFGEWAKSRKNMVLEFFYRDLRRKFGILMDGKNEPVGGKWNFDHDNRQSFPKSGPDDLPAMPSFAPDAISQKVIELVELRFADHPGSLAHFQLPVSRDDARAFLADFIEKRLPDFGTFEDAMWSDEPFLYHSRLSALLNVKLLDPRECVNAAVNAWQNGRAPLNAVEGFVRQILGWREFVRGIYWQKMPEFLEMNALNHTAKVPQFFWDGETEMNCVRHSMKMVIDHGYAHHIHRLMVLGLFAQLSGTHPRKFHEWHMAMYLDAIDWVSLPNTLGMSQFGDGGIVGTKPYCASGNYINKMSNYCGSCNYQYKQAVGENACPFTTLYWDFLDRHKNRLSQNQRMAMQYRNLDRKSDNELAEIRKHATVLKTKIANGESV